MAQTQNSTPRTQHSLRVGVLGTFVWDTIHHPDLSRPLEQWGGLAYCISAYSAACPAGWQVVPIAKVGEDLLEQARSFLSSLDNLASTAGIVAVPERNNRVELRYHDRAERTELLTGGVPAWSAAELEPILDGLDALYVNHMSGLEMDVTTAEAIRARFDGPIYTDLHSLFLEPPAGRPRVARPLPDAQRWLGTADVVQLNEPELRLLRDSGDDPFAAVRQGGPSAVLVTRGAAGAAFVARILPDGRPALPPASAEVQPESPDRVEHVPIRGGPLVGDPTGCGDIWGSVAFCGLLAGRPLTVAIERAHVAAAAKMSHPSMNGLVTAIGSALRSFAP